MLTGSVPISYRFGDKREFQSKMRLTPASRLNFISHLTSYCHHRCHRYLLTMHSITINYAPLSRPRDVANLLSTTSRCTPLHGEQPNKLRHITHARHTPSRHDDVRAAKYVQLLSFSTSLEPSFSDTRGSLNFLSVHSCSQNLPLISCMSAQFH